MSLEVPPTPKISNGKRDALITTNDELSLQRSLKRMKVTSASPGELRLQRDFKHAVCCAGWIPIGSCGNTWKVVTEGYTVKQCIEDPLHLVVHSPQWTVWLQIPRLYPHHPPILSRIECRHPRLEIIIQTGPEDPQIAVAQQRGAVLVRGWSPLMRLHEILSQLIVPLLEAPHPPCAIVEDAMEESPHRKLPSRLRYAEADCATESREPLLSQEVWMEDAEQYLLFPPNRFDLGYRREPSERQDHSLMAMLEE
jgi:ubiquitin-protein ligase